MHTPHSHLFLAALAAAALPAALPAQFAPLIPRSATLDLLVVDSSFDGVWRISDFNQNGSFNDPGEINVFYDDTIGSIALTNPTAIVVGLNGVAYVCDSTVDIVLMLEDVDGNGSALGGGEHKVFFDGVNNASGVAMASAQGITADLLGNVFVAVSNTSSVGVDMILKLTDLNADGDANDIGEAVIYCQIPNQLALGDSIPTEVVVAPDGKLYYAEVGATGVNIKGVYRCDDLNTDGDANDPGEVSLFWAPSSGGNPFYWGLAVAPDGTFYITDHGNEQVWRARDANNDGVIQASEEGVFYQTAASTFWDVVLREDGTVFLCEDQTPNRLTALRDLNADGDALDAGESFEAYDETVSATALTPRGASFMAAPRLSIQPATVRLGAATTLSTFTPRGGDSVGLTVSIGLAANPLPLPPVGEIELDTSLLISFLAANANSNGRLDVPLTIPNDPALVGILAFQAFAGDLYRPYLSNAVVLTITP